MINLQKISNALVDINSRLFRWAGDQPAAANTLGRNEKYAIIAIFLVGVFVRFYGLGHNSLWGDEAYTAMAVSFPWTTVAFTPFDVHPPAYYLIVKAITSFGANEVSLRLLSALAGSLTILVIWATGRNIMGSVCGLVAAAFVATSAIHIDFSQEARSYAFLVLLLSLTVYASVKTLSAKSDSSAPKNTSTSSVKTTYWIGLYAVAALISLYTHTLTIVFLAFLNAAVLVGFIIQRRKWNDRYTVRWILANAAIGLAYLPWLLALTQTAGDFGWLEHISLADAVYTTMLTLGSNILSAKANLLLLPIMGIGLVALIIRGKLATSGLILMLCAFPLIVWAIGFAKPIFMDRTILPALIGWAIAIGICAAVIRPAAIRYGLIVVLIGINGATAIHHLTTHTHSDLRQTATFLNSKTGSDDAIFLCDPKVDYHLAPYAELDRPMFVWWTRLALTMPTDREHLRQFYSLSVGDRGLLSKEDIIAMISNENGTTVELRDVAAEYDSIWLVKSHCDAEDIARNSAITDANLTLVEDHIFWQTSVTEYRLIPD